MIALVWPDTQAWSVRLSESGAVETYKAVVFTLVQGIFAAAALGATLIVLFNGFSEGFDPQAVPALLIIWAVSAVGVLGTRFMRRLFTAAR